MTDLRKAAEQALKDLTRLCHAQAYDTVESLRQALAQPVDAVNISAERVDETAKRKCEWEELDINDAMGLIAEHITDPSPELRYEIYGLIAEADMLLQEKNNG